MFIAHKSACVCVLCSNLGWINWLGYRSEGKGSWRAKLGAYEQNKTSEHVRLAEIIEERAIKRLALNRKVDWKVEGEKRKTNKMTIKVWIQNVPKWTFYQICKCQDANYLKTRYTESPLIFFMISTIMQMRENASSQSKEIFGFTKDMKVSFVTWADWSTKFIHRQKEEKVLKCVPRTREEALKFVIRRNHH